MRRRTSFAVIVFSLLSAGLVREVAAQNYPMPAKTPDTLVNCPATVCPRYPNFPTQPYSAPIKTFTGRFLDSQLSKDYQGGLRTLRAGIVKVSPERDRVYVGLGEGVAAYKLSTWFTKDLGSRLDSVNAWRQTTPEQYLNHLYYLYAEASESGWITSVADGQQRLYDFDTDDRGLLYVAYSHFGWGVVRDTGTGFSLEKQVLDAPGGAAALKSIAFRTADRYYAMIGNEVAFNVYDVTTASAATHVRTVTPSSGHQAIYYARTATSPDAMYVAYGDFSQVSIFRASSMASGGGAAKTIDLPQGATSFGGLVGDGTSIWVAVNTSANFKLLKVTPNVDGSFSQQLFDTGISFTATMLDGGDGYISAIGKNENRLKDTALFQLADAGPKFVNLKKYFQKYYVASATGYAKPDSYTGVINGQRVVRYNGRDYIVYSGHGMGDVYELQTRDMVAVDYQRTPAGTVNTNAPVSDGIVYGDQVRFTSVMAGTVVPTVNWNFDNPENPNALSPDLAVGIAATHQYAGATTLAAVTKTRNVSATDTSDKSNTSTVAVTLKAPEARIRLLGTDKFFTTSSTTPFPVLLGDNFGDGSDGTIQGHYSVWTLDQQATPFSPLAPMGAGLCRTEPHTLALAARYVPYAIGTTITPSLTDAYHYVKTAGPITYNVRPMIVSAAVGSSTPTQITFKTNFRAAAEAFAAGAQVKVSWEFNGTTTPVVPQVRTLTLAEAALDTFSVTKALISAAGSEVVLTVTAEPLALLPTNSCAEHTTAGSSYPLRAPDPTIAKSGCANVGSPCAFTASSLAGAPMADWTIAWFIDVDPTDNESAVPAATGLTFDAMSRITLAKDYRIWARATNASGAVFASIAISPAAALCSGVPKDVAAWTTGCSGTCTAGAKVTFNVVAYGYTTQDCDYFLWDFGDGSAVVRKEEWHDRPTHIYSSDGTYAAKVTVKNSAGANVVASLTVQVGSTTPPPPTCGAFPAAVGITARGTGACTDPTPTCTSSESVSFGIDPFYSFQSCDVFDWNFGDGSAHSSNKYPIHVFPNVGTFNVTLTWSKGSGDTISRTMPITITGSSSCATAPGPYIDFNYKGAQTQCSVGGSNCSANEQLTFTATDSFGTYKFQACDSFAWDFGDGTKATGKVATHTYSSTTTNPQVTLTVSNSLGSRVVPRSVQFGGSGACPTPVPSIASSRTASVGVPVNFAGSVLPADATVNTWEWNFGDSKSGSGQNVSHGFTAAGNYTVTLRVVLSCGNSAITTFNLNVTNAKSFSYLIPVVSHVTMPDGSSWRTDLQIFSEDSTISTSPMTLQAQFTGRTHGMTKDLVIGSSTFVSEDFQKFFVADADEFGSVILTGTAVKEPQIWTRLYLVGPSGVGTYGQLIPAIKLDNQPAAQIGPSRFYLPGLLSSPSYRTNIGLVNPNSAKVDLKLIAYDDVGTPLMEFSQSLLPYQMQQINDLAQRINEKLTGKRDSQLARPYMLVIENPAGTRIIAYHSTVDNISNDPIYVEAVPEESVLQTYNKVQILPGIGRIGAWKSDVTIYNPGDKIQVDIEYFDNSGKKAADVTNYWLYAKEEKVIADVLFAGLMNPAPTSDSSGFIKVTTKTDIGTVRHPVIEARTYNDRGALGTFGQGIRAFPLSHANVTATRDAFIAGVRKDLSYYTNIGLVNLGAEPARIQIVMLDRLDGHEIAGGTWERITQTINEKGETVWVPAPLAANESLIVSDIFKATGTTADRASVRIRMLSGTSAWAYASIVDQTTKDPEYVPAVPASK